MDWVEKFDKKLGYPLILINYSFKLIFLRIVEVSGDNTPDLEELNLASILVTTPEKWDGITRCAETRRYVQEVELLIIDEIHLLGVERGAVLEAIVTRFFEY